MTTSESKGRFYFFYEKNNSNRFAQRIESRIGMLLQSVGTPNKFVTVPQKWVNNDWVCITGMKRVYPFFKRFFSCFHMLSCLVMTTRQIVLAKYGNFPISPKIGGRGQESNNGVTTNPQLFIAYSRPFAGSGIWGK